jgi:hypothetical protein
LAPKSGVIFSFKTNQALGEPMENVDKKSQSDLEWENRTLCSDESCIGVIGPDGRCKECGKPFKG